MSTRFISHMSNTHTATDIKEETRETQIRHISTDAPLIPVDMLERMHGFRPDLVDQVIQLTGTEAEFRRIESRRVNNFTFVERLVGQIAGLLIGLSSVGGGIYLVFQGHDWAGVSIAGAGIAGLATAFVTGNHKSKDL